MEGKKYDNGKLRYDLIPPEVIEALATVLTYGSDKYGDNNWQGLEDANRRYYAALMRHVESWRKGEEQDQESGLKHLSHVLCNAAFLLYLNKDK